MINSHRVWNYVVASAALAVLFCATAARGQMLIKGYTAQTAGLYDRFLNDPAFIGNAYNWSGVGRGIYIDPNNSSTVVQTGGWGTMISPSYFISANHYNPGNTGANTLRFYLTNNPAGTYEDHTYTPVGQIPGGDLWIGKLNTPVGNNVAKYPVMSLPTVNDYANLPLYVFGLSTSIPGTDTSVRLGTNKVDAHNALSTGSTAPPVLSAPILGQPGYTYTFNYSNLPISSEAAVQPGDSGAPNFYVLNGMPALIGLNWYSLQDGTTVTGSGASAVPQYLSDLQLKMTSEFLSIVKTERILGDFNLDGVRSIADVQAMVVALTNLNSYKSLHGINQQYLLQIGDINGDLAITNADLQPLLNLISGAGQGSVQTVPEPATIVLFGLGCLALAYKTLRRRNTAT